MEARNFAKIKGLLIVLLSLPIGRPVMAEPNDWAICQLTNNSLDDRSPYIYGQSVVWRGADGNDFEIFLYDIDTNTTTQLTYNSYNDANPRVHGSNVVWYADNGTPYCLPIIGCLPTYEIFIYDGNGITQLTENSIHDVAPQIYGSNVVWYAYNPDPSSGDDKEIFLYDGSTITQLTNNGYDDQNPKVYEANVVWEAGQIFLHNIDANTTTQLTNTTYANNLGDISGRNIVWTGSPGGGGADREIFLYDGNSATQLTDNSYDDWLVFVSGENVVWSGQVNVLDYEIFYYDGATTNQITSDDYEDYARAISGSNAVWVGNDDRGDNEIFAYDGNTISQVTYNSNDDQNPQISGVTIVWEGHDGNDWEIFMAIPRCYPFAKPITDLNGDCVANFKDFAIFASGWLECNRYPQEDCDD